MSEYVARGIRLGIPSLNNYPDPLALKFHTSQVTLDIDVSFAVVANFRY